jgi:chemotaxis family two-component system sensor kinase Cph1
VRGCPGYFVQLFQNLVENAVKYHDGTPARVHISTQPEGRMWRFAVADNGVGVEAPFREQIFEVFKRLQHRDVAGTGIGLAICRRIVERCGGKIWVASNTPGGSIFYFTLPMVESAPD